MLNAFKGQAGFGAAGPEIVGAAEQFDQVLGAVGLNEIAVGAELVGAFDIFGLFGAAEHHGGNDAAVGVIIQPLEDFEAADTWHLDVNEHDAGEREFGAVLEFALTFKIVHDSAAIGENLNGIFKAEFAEGSFEEESVVGAIFGNENCEIAVHMCSSVRNRRGKL